MVNFVGFLIFEIRIKLTVKNEIEYINDPGDVALSLTEQR